MNALLSAASSTGWIGMRLRDGAHRLFRRMDLHAESSLLLSSESRTNGYLPAIISFSKLPLQWVASFQFSRDLVNPYVSHYELSS